MTAAPQKRQPLVDRTAWPKSLILFGMGIYLGLLILTGNLDNYINQRFAWLVVVGALLFFLLGLTNLFNSLKPQGQDQEHHHYHITWDILLVAAFPLLLAILIPSRSLGIEAVNGGVSLSPVGVASVTRSPLDRNILDWLREFDRAATPAQFNGASVDVTGFVYREPIHPADGFMLARFTMSCCVPHWHADYRRGGGGIRRRRMAAAAGSIESVGLRRRLLAGRLRRCDRARR